MFDHLLDSNKWSNIEFGQEMSIIEIKMPTLSGALGLSVFDIHSIACSLNGFVWLLFRVF